MKLTEAVGMMTRLISIAAIGLAAAVALAACNDNGSTGSTSSNTTAAGLVGEPQANGPLSEQVDAVNEALADGSCMELEPFVLSVDRPVDPDTGKLREPGSPPTKEECKTAAGDPLSTLYKVGNPPIEFSDSTEYGTGGVSEGTGRVPKGVGDRIPIGIWVVDTDGEWRLEHIYYDYRQIGVEPRQVDETTAIAQRFVQSTSAGSCDPSTISPVFGRLAVLDFSPERACKYIDRKGRFFGPSIRATPDPVAIGFGGIAHYSFYGVATKYAFFTLVMIYDKRGAPQKVAYIDPSTPVDLPEKDSSSG